MCDGARVYGCEWTGESLEDRMHVSMQMSEGVWTFFPGFLSLCCADVLTLPLALCCVDVLLVPPSLPLALCCVDVLLVPLALCCTDVLLAPPSLPFLLCCAGVLLVPPSLPFLLCCTDVLRPPFARCSTGVFASPPFVPCPGLTHLVVWEHCYKTRWRAHIELVQGLDHYDVHRHTCSTGKMGAVQNTHGDA